MGIAKRRRPSWSEQLVIKHLEVRLVTAKDEIERFDKLIEEHHYLHSAKLVGKYLRYVATYEGEWLALASWSGAAFHLRDRDEFIGWSEGQRLSRLPLLANNSRLLVLPGCHLPNLLTRFMKRMLDRLSDDWRRQWGHPLALVETFVDPRLFQGTSYKASAWRHIGMTAGWKRDAADFYQKHDAPKQLWVRELSGNACRGLRAEELPRQWESALAKVRPRCRTKSADLRSLADILREELPEFRRTQALGYPVAGLVALTVMAMATGVRLGAEDLEDYADTLSPAQLGALRFRRCRHTGNVRCPKRGTFQRMLAGVDAPTLERALLIWQEQVLGPARDDLVIVDGKKMRHGRVEIVNACDGNGRYLGSVMTDRKSNEVPAARELLSGIDLSGKSVLCDALHTNADTARQIVFDQGGHYLMTVKDNQPGIVQRLKKLFEKTAFSPCPHATDPGASTGEQPRPPGGPRP